MSASSTCQLHYFDIRGKAEPIRLMFEDAAFPYEDIRFDRASWFGGVKEKYRTEGLAPFGQVPIVVHDGKKMCQSYVPYSVISFCISYCELLIIGTWQI